MRYCVECRRPIYLTPYEVPHLDQATRQARQTIAALPPTAAPDVLVTPVGIEYMRLSYGLGLPPERVQGFLDASPERLQLPFRDRPVHLRTREIILALAPRAILICSTRYQEAILADLEGADLPGITLVPLFS